MTGKGKEKAKDIVETIQGLGINTPVLGDIKANIQLLEQLYKQFKSIPCNNPSCRNLLQLGSYGEQLTKWYSGAQPSASKPTQMSILSCQRCAKVTCVGCGKKPSIGQKFKTGFAIVSNCCDRGRLFEIWILLARFDQVELKFRMDAAGVRHRSTNQFSSYGGEGFPSLPISFSAAPSSRYQGPAPIYRDLSPGFHGPLPSYHSPSSSFHHPIVSPSSGCQSLFSRNNPFARPIPDSKINGPNTTMDEYLTWQLTLLTAFLPNPEGSSTFDTNPPPELHSLFRLGFLLDRVTALIRNDAIADMTQRSELYKAVFSFVTAIAKHPGLVLIITEKRPGKKHFAGLQQLCEDPPPKNCASYFDESPSGLVASVVSCCHNTHRQAKSYTDLVSKATMAGERHSKESQVSLEICRRIVGFYQTVKLTAPDAFRSNKASGKDVWTEFHEENRVSFTDAVLTDHMFHSEFTKINYSKSGRMIALGKEIANLSTSLPPGIFLKIGESRQDVMKALIIGVEGTPYAGGLFIFDIFLPAEWPNVPPKFYSVLDEGLDRRHGGPTLGQGGLNPNVHSDGKVCLSLLNTWAGSPSEMWQPNKSTLLSVLVSIQSMIFGAAHPYLNEPGMAHTQPNSPQSIAYTKIVQCKVVLHAMLWWLRSEKARTGVWAEISEIYWMCKGEEVLKTVREWMKSNPQLRNYSKQVKPSYAQGMVGPMDFHPHFETYNAPPQAGTAGADLVKELGDQLGLESEEEKGDVGSSQGGPGPSTMPGSWQPAESGGPSKHVVYEFYDYDEWESWPGVTDAGGSTCFFD